MKKIIFSMFLLYCFQLYSEPIYKNLPLDDEFLYKWVNVTIEKYDTSGKTIYKKNHKGIESWYEYNNDQLIHFKDSIGNEQRNNEFGQLVYFRTSSGVENYYDPKPPIEEKKEYDKNGNLIYQLYYNGTEKWYKYNSHGKKLYEKELPSGYECWYEYDQKGNLIHSSDSKNWWVQYKYDKDNNLIYMESESIKKWYKYNEKKQLTYEKIYYLDNNPIVKYEEWTEYDKNNHKCYSYNSKGIKTWYKYDSNGREIYTKNSKGNETKHNYDTYGNLTYKNNGLEPETWYEYKYNQMGQIVEKTIYESLHN